MQEIFLPHPATNSFFCHFSNGSDPVCVCFSAGGADEQHRAGAELPATDQQHHQPVQPAAFLEHVQQVQKYSFPPSHTHINTAHIKNTQHS